MLRFASILAILATSAPALAGESDTASNLHNDTSGGHGALCILAFAIIFVTLARLLVKVSPES